MRIKTRKINAMKGASGVADSVRDVPQKPKNTVEALIWAPHIDAELSQ